MSGNEACDLLCPEAKAGLFLPALSFITVRTEASASNNAISAKTAPGTHCSPSAVTMMAVQTVTRQVKRATTEVA